MSVNRREFLKMAGLGIGGLLLPSTPKKVLSAGKAENSASMLYDGSICVGCRACQMACKKRSNLPPEKSPDGLHEAPQGLSANTWTLIKLYKDTGTHSFIKAQCMHCIEPACVSVCPVGALEKTASGPVVYHQDRCIGCRYCMAACPFGIPKTQWEKPFPLIQKCDFCADRLAKGLEPACGAVCPTGALISGKRGLMMETARKRITDDPAYINHVYGDEEAGGTSMLYIAKVSFEKLGLPNLGPRPLPNFSLPYMIGIPPLILAVSVLATSVYLYTHRRQEKKEA